MHGNSPFSGSFYGSSSGAIYLRSWCASGTNSNYGNSPFSGSSQGSFSGKVTPWLYLCFGTLCRNMFVRGDLILLFTQTGEPAGRIEITKGNPDLY